MSFDSLYVEEEELNEELLEQVLNGRLRLTQNCEVLLQGGFSAKDKILLYLLGRKVLAADGHLDVEGASNKEIADGAGIKKGTVDPGVRDLNGEQLLTKDAEGRYYVPNHALEAVKGRFKQ